VCISKMKLLSIDVGEKNFAFSVLEKNGTTVTVTDAVLVNIQAEKKKDRSIINACITLTSLFETDERVIACDLVVIEQQVRSNIRAQKLAQHVWSYFYTKFLNTNKRVSFVPASLKTQILFGAEQKPTETNGRSNTLDYKQRKKWSIVHVTTGQLIDSARLHGLEVTVPENIVHYINSLKKKDDVCDTIVQAVAYIIKQLM
jgi:hypothetical protein